MMVLEMARPCDFRPMLAAWMRSAECGEGYGDTWCG